MNFIPFNKPYFSGLETEYIKQAVNSGKISGNGEFTHKCHDFFQRKYGFKKCLLTTSCTDALEMAAILCDIQPEDEVIVPSFTFVSTANAFVLRGAKIVFADSRSDHPGIDEKRIEELITPRTRVIIPVHYAGVACDMDKIMEIAKRHDILVVEDAAQAIDSYYKGRPLGSIGHFSCFSFHETKNIISGEGGMLVINDERFFKRAEIIWEKGTNRADFFRGEVNKYQWVDIGSSFLPTEIVSAFLFAQLENIEKIQGKRISLWKKYYEALKHLKKNHSISLPYLPEYSTINGHIFYLICNSLRERNLLIDFLRTNKIHAVFHYLPLHLSDYYSERHDQRILEYSIHFSERLLRLPLFFNLTKNEVERIINCIIEFYEN
jgi:dTDP-4-amino-4,6-dideoxygalactose transaminase